ncbi:hypothetical protein LIA77_03317 [Sarocladium implicatum]|nr:hypothetical protein LIA77_03317 [Sarocladium implicatum]
MADVGNASARLRKTFHYPADDDDGSNSEPEAMDEQEQENYIARLAAENTSRNTQFRRLLLALPAVSSLPYIPALFRPSTTLLALLSLTSLASSVFLLLRLPLTSSGFPALDAWAASGSTRLQQQQQLKKQRQAILVDSPLETWLPSLNLGLAGVLVLLGFVSAEAWRGAFGWIGMGNLPAVVFGVVVASKLLMGSVDPEAELGALKYDYKGA